MAQPVAAAVNWQQVASFPGGNVSSLAIDPGNRQIVYASTSGRLFRTGNGGSSWDELPGFTSATGTAYSFNSIVLDRTNSQNIYAATNYGVLKSTDGGASWTHLNNGLISHTYTVAIDPGNNQTVYAGTSSGVFKSIDAGGAWSAASSGMSSTSVPSLAIDPTNSQTIYAGTHAGLFKSTNAGSSWSDTGLSATHAYYCLAIDPANGQTVYAGTNAGGIFKTTNGGGSWNAVNNGLSPSNPCYALAIDPSDSETVYAATYYGGILKTATGGFSWSAVNTGLTNLSFRSLAIDPVDRQTLYTGAAGSGVFRSTNAGANWSSANNGLNAAAVNSVVNDSANGQIFYAGTGGGVFKSADGGISWSAKNTGLTNASVYTLAMDRFNSQVIYAGTLGRGVFKTTDGGSSWNAINSGLSSAGTPYGSNPPVYSLAIDPNNAQVLYAGIYGGGVFKSTNGGGVWSAVNSGLTTNSYFYTLVIDPSDSQIIYAGTNSGVFKSSNGGASWSAMNSGLPASYAVRSLAVSTTNNQTVYAATNGGGVFKTTNGGASWSAVNSGMTYTYVSSLAIDPNNDQAIYAGASGISKSVNAGATWKTGQVTATVNAIVVERTGSQTLYAATTKGLYKVIFTKVPGPPSGVTATAGNGQAAVGFAAPADTGDSFITLYTVTSTPGNLTATGTASPITVTGLTNGVDYTFTVVATNAYGTGAMSIPSNRVTPCIAPDAPTNVTAAIVGDGKVLVGFALPADNGGSTIASYKVTSNPGNISATGTASPITVSGLTSGTTYTFTVTATNNAWTGPPSTPSNSVTACSVPGVPSIVTATSGNNRAIVSINPPYNSGGSAITSYKVTSIPDNVTAVGTGTSIVVDGLTNGTAYTFIVSAVNAAGAGPTSAPSASITPMAGSTDLSWSIQSMPRVQSLVIDPYNNQILYAGTEIGVFKTTNGGASWSVVSSGIPSTGVGALVIHPANSQILYAGTSGGVFKTTNGGASWSAVSSGITATGVGDLVIDPANGQILYAGTPSGVFKTTNGGASWSAVNGGLTSTGISSLAIDPSNTQIVYAGTSLTLTYTGKLGFIRGGVFKTTNGGVSWSAVDGGLADGLTAAYSGTRSVAALAVDPGNSQTIYAGTNDGRIFKTNNGGASWGAVNGGLTSTNISSLAIDPVNHQTVYAGTSYGGGMFKTTDGGASWSAVNGGLTGTALTVAAIAVDPANSQTVYVGTGGGMFKTTNSGASWSVANGGMTSTGIMSLAVDPADSQIVYAGTSNGMFKTTNGGASWNPVNGLSHASTLAIDPDNSQTLYAGTQSAVFKTTNGGASWSAVNSGLTNNHVTSLAIDPGNGQTVYAGTDGGGVFKTTDGGASWSAVNGGLTSNSSVYTLAIDPSNGQTVYAGTSYGALFKTTNGGASWSAANRGLTNSVISLAIDPSNSQTVFAGTTVTSYGNGYEYGGVFKSTDGGASWSNVNGAPTGTRVHVLAIDPQDPAILFAAMNANVFRGSSANRLTVQKIGNGNDSVVSDRGNIFWAGTTGFISYPTSSTAVLTPALAPGSIFAGWSGCDSTVGTSCVVTMNSDRDVTATFSLATYTVTPSSGPGGSITPATPHSVHYGGSSSFVISPAPGFITSSVTGCGGTLSENSYTTGTITADCTVQASFTPTITGIVTDLSTGKPIATATVTITGGAATQTDADGYFKFSTPPAYGVYSVTISKTGYNSAATSGVTVSATSGGAVKAGLVPTSTVPFNITSNPSLAPATTDVVYSQPVTISGGSAPYSFSPAYGVLPPGLTIDGTLGTICGTPAMVGSYPFAVGVTDGLGVYAEREFTINVTGPLIITTGTLPRGMSSATYAAAVAAQGGRPPYGFSLFSGALPTGITLDGTTGALRGKITSAVGSYGFAVKVIDSEGRGVIQPYTLAVDPLLGQTTTRLKDAIVGTAYSQTLTVTGGHAPYRSGIYAGTLPPDLSLDPFTGIISGTPTAAATRPLSISATDHAGRAVYQQFTLRVLEPLQIPTTTLPNGFVGAGYSEPVRVTGGMAPFSYSIVGQLPAGLAINPSTGIVSGTPTIGGYTNVSITVTDSTWPTPQSRTVPRGIRVWTQLTVTSASIFPNARKGVAITALTMAARGGTTPYSWSVAAGYLPQGMTLNPATGVVSGTPADTGEFSFTMRVTDSSATPTSADKKFYLRVSATLNVATAAVPTGGAGVPYSASLTATGGLKPHLWLVKSGTLPSGLTLDGATGIVSGTPTAKITSSVTFQVNDGDTPPQSAQRTFNIEIKDTLAISEVSLPSGRKGQAYVTNLRPLLGTPPHSWQVSAGALPPGLALQQSAGVASLQGTPSAPGSYSFTLKLTDSGSPAQSTTREFTIQIHGPLAIGSSALKNAQRGAAHSDSVLASGGALPYSYQIASGSLPQGLVFNSTTGEISGSTNADTGYTSSFTVRVNDAGVPPASVERQFTIQVTDPMSIATAALPGGAAGVPFSVTLAGQGGISPRNWSLSSGSLPAGVALNGTSGLLAGTPATCGSFPFTLQLADSSPVPSTVQKGFTLTVPCGAGGPYHLSATLAGSGGGSLNSVPSGIACVSGSSSGCTASFAGGLSVTIIPSADSDSTFTGWSGACSNPTGNCTATMTGARSVTATFTKAAWLRLLGAAATPYATLQNAYAAAASGNTIQGRGVSLTENLILNRPISVFFKGGYDSSFTSASSTTKVKGKVLIRQGSVRASKLTIY